MASFLSRFLAFPSDTELLDLSLIPTYDLPLQTTLYFAACPVPLAANYLINRSVAEGVQVSSTTLCAIQDSCSEPTAEPYFTSLRSDISECDLRRCIHELQFHSAMDRQTTVPRDYCSREQWNKVLDEVADWPVGETRKDRYLVTMGMHMENASLVDAGYIAHVDVSTINPPAHHVIEWNIQTGF